LGSALDQDGVAPDAVGSVRSQGGGPLAGAQTLVVDLANSVELCLLLVEKSLERFERAALRWHGRYCRELRDVDLAEGLAAARKCGRKCANLVDGHHGSSAIRIGA
jgi:hypothetical protein